MERWDRAGEGGRPPTVDTALLSGRILIFGEGGLPPTTEPATDSAGPPAIDGALDPATDPTDKKILY